MKIPKRIIKEMLEEEKYHKQLKILVTNFLIDKALKKEEELEAKKKCRVCGKKLEQIKGIKYGRICRLCYNRKQKEYNYNKSWKDFDGKKPKPYLTNKGITSGDMSQENCSRIIKNDQLITMIPKRPFKILGKKIVMYEAKDKTFRVQIYSPKYDEEKWFKFKIFKHAEFFSERIRSVGWKYL